MGKDDLIIKDYIDRIEGTLTGNKYLRLYNEQSDDFKKIFAYFHEYFNYLFEFLNEKDKVNKHYNAGSSRDLINLIEEFEELRYTLKDAGQEIVLNKTYQEAIEFCKTFLSPSGGSTIPDDFRPIKIIKYEPILELANKSIHIASRGQTFQLSMIGQGAFSIVQKYKDPYYQKEFAVKQAKKNSTERELTRFKREFDILKDLSFPYILEVYAYDDKKNSYVMEYCNTTLDTYIKRNNTKLGFYSRKKLALQFLYGVNYLHKKSILHRDLSYRNILLKQYDYGVAIIKLSDFGLIKEKRSEYTQSDSEIKGTIVDPSLEKFKDYNVLNEMYAIGFILGFIFTGKQNLSHGIGSVHDIIRKCIDHDPTSRYDKVTDVIKDVEALTE